VATLSGDILPSGLDKFGDVVGGEVTDDPDRTHREVVVGALADLDGDLVAATS
jgi:hypothetical protein